MSSSAATVPQAENQLPLAFQYTVEAYKTFQKLAELLPNPLSAQAFASIAQEERIHRNLLEMRYTASGNERMYITLAEDLRFQDALEGDLSYRELAEMLIVRERTMERKLNEWAKNGVEAERNLYSYIAGGKRAHVAVLERELQMIRLYPDWFKREDAESLVVHGKARE